MQCRWVYHESCDTRGQQGENSTLGRTATSHTVSQVEGHARTKERNRRTAQHDAFRYGADLIHCYRTDLRPDDNRQQLVNAGAIPVLVQLLSSPDVDVQYYCTTALSNIAVDATNRAKLAQTEGRLVGSLVHLMESSSPKVQCQAALALRNLASDERYQLEIVRARGLPSLLRLLQSSYLPLILSAVACIRNISIHPANESPIIEAGFLRPLVDLLGSTENDEIQCHAISTLRNLAASSDKNKQLVLEAGAVQKCKQLVLNVRLPVQSEMTAAIAVLALSEELKPHLLNLGVFDVLIPLTESESIEVQGNSAAALGNLSSKGKYLDCCLYATANIYSG
jgi:vacuolar protein 8